MSNPLSNDPKCDLSYYDGIVDKKYADTVSLISTSYCRFLKGITKDLLLSLPSIGDAGPHAYKDADLA